ncbi:alpha/beta hydrolase [Actinoallomurus soli]|uniref:alpha/beta hydrolase n=1 Tax=Actinoallomurus soli TaxID=2952535 RepID=UPI002093959B|nr:alpha/beta hydrolase [Actinoallomurus soli]MCO5969043.1 alpha/beta hydrolase [Actinoallomurus soli]
MFANDPIPVLEPEAATFAKAMSEPPYLYGVDPAETRHVFDGMQSGRVDRPDVAEEWAAVPGGPTGAVRTRIVRPRRADGPLPVVLYLHGGGWVCGNARTHDRLVRELAVGAEAAVVFPEYDLSPEARYPVAIEQAYSVARWVVTKGADEGLDAARLAVAGDSVGGNMAAALTLMAKNRCNVHFVRQVLLYPVTDASFDTDSYHRFAENYSLRRDTMRWFWGQYIADPRRCADITASPLRATTGQLAGLPPALVVTAEADVVRDEGEAYANKLRAARVPVTAVRYQGVIHGFMTLNALRSTYAAEDAITQAITVLRTSLETV